MFQFLMFIIQIFYMTLDGERTKIKVVEVDDMYIFFAVKKLFTQIHLVSQILRNVKKRMRGE